MAANWTKFWGKWAQIAPKTYDVYFLASKPRNQTITDLETVATLPITSVVDVFGQTIDGGISRLVGNLLKIQGTDGSKIISQGTMAAPSGSVIYYDGTAQYAAFNQRVYVV